MTNPFEQLAEQLATLQESVNLLLKEKQTIPQEENQWLSVEDLMKYDPSKPAKATIYGWVHYKSIPFFKKGKRIFFRRDQIDEWLNSNRKQTAVEIEHTAEDRIKSKSPAVSKKKVTKSVIKNRV